LVRVQPGELRTSCNGRGTRRAPSVERPFGTGFSTRVSRTASPRRARRRPVRRLRSVQVPLSRRPCAWPAFACTNVAGTPAAAVSVNAVCRSPCDGRNRFAIFSLANAPWTYPVSFDGSRRRPERLVAEHDAVATAREPRWESGADAAPHRPSDAKGSVAATSVRPPRCEGPDRRNAVLTSSVSCSSSRSSRHRRSRTASSGAA
jgi:hypothetical protein